MFSFRKSSIFVRNMWKCGTRRFRDTVERGANQYDKCSSAGINPPWCEFFAKFDKKERHNESPCCWFNPRKCWNSFYKENDTNQKRWNFEHLNRTWIGAIAWSSALVFSWYTSHLIHLNVKKNRKDKKKYCVPKIHNILDSLPAQYSKKSVLNLNLSSQIEKFLGGSQVYAVSNDSSDDRSEAHTSSGVWTSHSGSIDDDLGQVLNSIENQLGLSEIENGNYDNGLSLLRSAASRNHAPAIYNLALCYEMGRGVPVDEKIAMGLYRTAASMHHAGALFNLGVYYGQGRGGLPRDHVTAKRLLKLAAVQGQEEAVKAIKLLDPDTGNKSPDSAVDSIINDKKDAPTVSSLFIQNLQLQNFNYEPIVF
ncbi:uncharacterized protein LOC121735738 [Aricia agestis]|uniref:uncharacterized protein LOC121735738 n=1 Tax=Aricia agestis TaxID=91739 RepID=UPI001C203225|nr:uncharacterized protein LOC121735738 [Aricia agestis]